MGEAKEKLLRASQEVLFDFAAPKLHFVAADRKRLAQSDRPDGPGDDRLAVPRAVWVTIQQIQAAAYPQGMGRHDGKLWAAWQESWQDDVEALAVVVTLGQIEWLKKQAVNDDLKLPGAFAQWREALIEYLLALEQAALSLKDNTELAARSPG